MTTAGEILHNARLEKKLTIAEAEAATKIRAKFLTAMENNEFGQLPPGTFARGFIKNYATFLGLPAEEILAFYRRQVNESKVDQTGPPRKRQRESSFKLTPQLFTSISVALLVILFFGYLVFSYLTFAGAPSLIVNSPKNNLVTTSDQMEVMGKTDPDATLTINNQVVTISENGSFDTKITLLPGINTITVTATNKFKRQSTISRNVRLEKG